MTRSWLLPTFAGLALLSAACQGVIDGVGSGDPGGGTGTGGFGGPTGTGGFSSGGSTGGVTGSVDAGSGGNGNGNGNGGGTGGSTGGNCSAGALPAAVQAMLNNTCITCHGHPPAQGVPASLTNFAELTAKSASDPSKTNAQLALARLQDNAKPMPPAPLSRASASDIAALQSWISAGMQGGSCPDGGVGKDAGTDGSGATDTGMVIDPFSLAPICTSKRSWTGGNRGNQQMNPGLACIACHSKGDGPGFAIAGTLYPTGHEPDLCNGVSGTTGAQVVIVGANGQQVTLTPNAAGNFDYQGTISKPYKAKVVYMGRERAMITAQTSGDCNSCHTQNGTMLAGTTMKAPGRIVTP